MHYKINTKLPARKSGKKEYFSSVWFYILTQRRKCAKSVQMAYPGAQSAGQLHHTPISPTDFSYQLPSAMTRKPFVRITWNLLCKLSQLWLLIKISIDSDKRFPKWKFELISQGIVNKVKKIANILGPPSDCNNSGTVCLNHLKF